MRPHRRSHRADAHRSMVRGDARTPPPQPSDPIRFVPDHWTSTYNHWLENVHDWCISRQLWWGHRIPAWYAERGNIVVARNVDEAARKSGKHAATLTQDPDVLDTWFSSALW